MKLQEDDPDLPVLRAMANRDPQALDALYRRHGPRLLAYLAGRLNDRGLAEEVLQDVMLSAWQSAARFRGECRVYTWLVAIARNRAINAARRRGAFPVSLEDAPLAWLGEKSAEIESFGAFEGLHSALLALSAGQREILELVFFHELSLKETAYVLRLPDGTVKSRLHRAKARLRELMESEAKPNE